MKVHKNKIFSPYIEKIYVLLSTETHETMYERIDNTVYTGRACRILAVSSTIGSTGPNCHDKAIKAINQFARLGKGKKMCMARVHSGKGLWQTVIQD